MKAGDEMQKMISTLNSGRGIAPNVMANLSKKLEAEQHDRLNVSS